MRASHLDYDLPLVSPEEAGARLARLAGPYDLVLYETFLTDLAGHRRIEPEWVLTRLDAFLGGLSWPTGRRSTTLVLCSDHGNLEDSTTKAHTPTRCRSWSWGRARGPFARPRAITDVTPAHPGCLIQGIPPQV